MGLRESETGGYLTSIKEILSEKKRIEPPYIKTVITFLKAAFFFHWTELFQFNRNFF